MVPFRAQREKCCRKNSFEGSTDSRDSDLPTYTLTEPPQEADLSTLHVKSDILQPQGQVEPTHSASIQKAEELSVVTGTPAAHAF